MLTLNDIKTGKNILIAGVPYAVLYHEHSKMGRAGSVLRTKLKNLLTGAVLEKTFQGADKVEEADIVKSKAQFIYRQDSDFYFMDNGSYDQFSLPEKVLGDASRYLKEGTEVTFLNFNEQAINIELPVKIKFKVTEAPPGIKGNTVSSGGKLVTLETGIKVSAPLFVKEGDEIIVNTEKGEYVERA